jgi:hypothetical protein
MAPTLRKPDEYRKCELRRSGAWNNANKSYRMPVPNIDSKLATSRSR